MRNSQVRQRKWSAVWWVVAVSGVAALAHTAAGDEINLNGSVRLVPGAEVVRLGDIAGLVGARAERLADTVVADAPGGGKVLEISVRQVRQALSDADVHWGKVLLSGRTVIVRPAFSADAAPPLAMTPAAIASAARTPPRRVDASRPEPAADIATLRTVRGVVSRAVTAGLGAAPDDLRLIFNDEHDGAVLDTAEEAFRFEIQPLGSLHSDRLELRVRAWAGGRVQQEHTIAVRPLIRTDVAVLRRDLDRGEPIYESDLEEESRWLPPSQARDLAGVVQAVGRLAATRLRAGEPLRARHIKREHLIRNGDRVVVRCLVGGVVISLEAEARGNGAEGDRIELRKLGERHTFMATVSGPGAAVIDLSR